MCRAYLFALSCSEQLALWLKYVTMCPCSPKPISNFGIWRYSPHWTSWSSSLCKSKPAGILHLFLLWYRIPKEDTNQTATGIRARQATTLDALLQHRGVHRLRPTRKPGPDTAHGLGSGCQTNFSLGHGLDPGRITDAMFGPDYPDGPGSAQYSEVILSFL